MYKIIDGFIFEKVYVETPVDTDRNGMADLIAAYIVRPDDTSVKVPAVFVANPYLMTCNEDWYKPYDVNRDINIITEEQQFESTEDFSIGNDKFDYRTPVAVADSSIVDNDVDFECISDLYEHLNKRGYATVFSGGLGTLGSEGITMSGSREEILAFKAVIDWLNGRCRAYTDKESNIEIKANWCTGNVAMSAKSYLGTMCIGVATTGVEGLKAIIPEAGISNWYEYYRYNGLNLPALGWQGDDLDILSKYCFSRAKDEADFQKIKSVFSEAMEQLRKGQDRFTSNYNSFWEERNYLKKMDNFNAASLIIHGINDWNVKTNQCFPLYEELKKRGKTAKLLLHQGEHIYAYNLKESPVLETIDKWLDFYLKGIDNGVDEIPDITAQSNLNRHCWKKYSCWPIEGASKECFPISGTDDEITFVDNIVDTVYDFDKDNLDEWLDQLILTEDDNYKNRVKFLWNPFDKFKDRDEIIISGDIDVSFSACHNRKTAVLSAMIVDVGRNLRISSNEIYDEEGNFDFELKETEYKVISRGWLNAQNRFGNSHKEEIEPGEYYDYSFKMIPTYYELKRGNRLALIIYGTDAQATERSKIVTETKIKRKSIKVNLNMR